jgi:hypothetical protein
MEKVMIKIRELADPDIVPLAELLARGFPHTLALGFPYTTTEFWVDLFNLWWTTNPAYSEQFPRGWVLEKDTKLVGFIGNVPVKFLIRGEVTTAAASNGWFVDPSIRGLFSLKLFNEFIQQKFASLLLFKIENESFLKITSRYKFEHYFLPKSQKEYVYIINKKKVESVFLSFLFNKKISKFSDILELIGRFGYLICAYLYQKPVTPGGILPYERYISSVCTSCDDSFSSLWKPFLNACDVTLSRDTKTLNWLYFSSARLRKRIVIQCRRSHDNTLAGYMVFDIQREKPSAAGKMQLMDQCIENNDPQVLTSLLSFAIEIGKQNEAGIMVVWANNPETESYLRKRFTLRRNAQYHRYIRFPEPHEISAEEHPENVCPTMIYPPQ